MESPQSSTVREDQTRSALDMFEKEVLNSMERVVATLGEAGKKDDVANGLKRMSRGKMLHAVLTQKHPEIKIDDMRKMSLEWLHGMLDVTFAVEARMIDEDFKDVDMLHTVIAALDAGDLWKYADAARRLSAEKPSQEEINTIFQKACHGGSTGFKDVVPYACAESQVIGVELWEALCWRRGGLRYYYVCTAVKTAIAVVSQNEESLSEAAIATTPKAVLATKSAAEMHGTIMEEAIRAFAALLDARKEKDDPTIDNEKEESRSLRAEKQTAKLLSYGIYSDTHLLALVYQGDLSYWLWLSTKATIVTETSAEAGIGSELAPEGSKDKSTPTKKPEGTQSSASGDSSGDSDITPCSVQEATALSTTTVGTKWLNKACSMLRRYVYVVEDLMEGCGWSTERAKALLSILTDNPTQGIERVASLSLKTGEQRSACDRPNQDKKRKKKKGKKKRK